MKLNIPNQEGFVSELQVGLFQGILPKSSPIPRFLHCVMLFEAGTWINGVTLERCCDAADGLRSR